MDERVRVIPEIQILLDAARPSVQLIVRPAVGDFDNAAGLLKRQRPDDQCGSWEGHTLERSAGY